MKGEKDRESGQRRNPSRPPVIGPERIEEIRRELESRPPKSPFRGARGWTCPECGKPTLNWSESLTLDWVDEGERILLTNLTGLLCDACGEKSYDAAASRIISQAIRERRPPTGYSATVSALGGGKLGIYLPKDVLKSVGWRRGTELRLTPLTKRKIVVEVDE
jgi:hypothetical protein